MDLQAVRYAAMVSTMSFADVVATYQAFLDSHQSDEGDRLEVSPSGYRPPSTCGLVVAVPYPISVVLRK